MFTTHPRERPEDQKEKSPGLGAVNENIQLECAALQGQRKGELEDKELIKSRIKEASKYVPLEQICLSPQCGFASTHHGNKLTEEEQWEKLKFIVDISKEIWG